jgi:hypothetical protein
MERKYDFNSQVIYVDPKGVRRAALVTVWWTGDQEISTYRAANGEPGCNLVFVSGDENRKDSCGRQVEHATSVVHKAKQVAHGNYWCWPDEV